MMELWGVPLIVCSSVAILSFIIGYYEGKESKPKGSPGIIAALEHDCDLIAANCKDLRFKNDELLMDNKDLRDQLKGIISKNNYLSRSNGQFKRNLKK